MALGGIFGSILGGYALNNLQIDIIFLLFSVLPSVQLVSCGLVKEKPVGNKVLPEFSAPKESHTMNGSLVEEDNSSFEKSKTRTSRRKKKQKKSKKRPVITNKFQIPEKDGSLAVRWFQSLKMATNTLFRAFRQPVILR